MTDTNSSLFGVPPETFATVRSALLEWVARHGRDLPWRHTRDPYKIMVSEIMLQQTQVDRVMPKYQAFLEIFPSLAALAAALELEPADRAAFFAATRQGDSAALPHLPLRRPLC